MNTETRDLKKTGYYAYACAWVWLTHLKSVGTNIFDREWDALLVLDSCRVDLITDVAGEYSFIQQIDSIRSVGSITTEWMSQTFKKTYRSDIRETAFVSASPHTETVFNDRSYLTNDPPVPLPFPKASVVDSTEFALFDEVWRYGYDEEVGVVPPRPVTDRAISVGRDDGADRLIVHYLQPHEPFIGADINTHASDNPVWESLQREAADPDEIWRAYTQNLRLVLDDVSLLLENLDANTVIITADHGNMFGEWGVFGHPIGFPHPSVKRVPWIETTAEDAETYDPDTTPSTGENDDIDEMLQQLGYLQ